MERPKPTLVPLENLTTTDGLQARSALDADTLNDYAQLFADGVKLPPIECIATDGGLLVTDGFHRVNAARQAGKTHVLAVVVSGSWSDAVFAAAGANRTHGLRRSIADKRKAVAMLLADARWGLLSDREIARHVGVTHPFVASMRKRTDPATEIETPAPDSDPHPTDDADRLDAQVERRMDAAKELLSTLASDLAAIHAAAKALIEQDRPEAAFLSSSLLSDLKNAAAAIRFAMPAAVCPYCSGDGCDTCKRGGWVGKMVWDNVPAELKS
jgi:hypothetical protein